jgi:hypothetical protein
MDMKTMSAMADEMKSHMEKMRTQMSELQATMAHKMTTIDAANAAMQGHIATIKANRTTEIELKYSMRDHMQMVMDRISALSKQNDMTKKFRKTEKKTRATMRHQK